MKPLVGPDYQAQSVQIDCAFDEDARRLRCWTRKHDVQVNSSGCFGRTGMVKNG